MIHPTIEQSIKYLGIQSKAFGENEMIPQKYSCDGFNVSPPLDISFIPNDAVCFVLIMEDPDAPINIWSHWVVWNIPVTHHIEEGNIFGVNGLNDFNKYSYCGPCPLAGIHKYTFKVYALDTTLDLKFNARKIDVEKAMSGHILAYGEISAFYGRRLNSMPAVKN